MEEEGRFPGREGEPESEMMVVVRALLAEQRRADLVREEARKAEEERSVIELRRADIAREDARREEEERREEARQQREAEAARRQAERQAEAEQRQFNQQVALLKLQAEMGEKASQTHRETQSNDRKRDRALFSIPVYKEGEDIECFLSTAERRLRAAEVPQNEWIPIIDTRLSGAKAVVWQDITVIAADYVDARDKLLRACGYTPSLAADSFFGFRVENSKGLSADQLYQRGQQLLRRMVAPGRVGDQEEFAILRGWVGNVISRKARAALGAREVKDAAGLISALQDFLMLEGERGEGQAVIFKKGSSETPRERSVGSITCYKCGRAGHKAADCWGSKGGSGPKVGSTGTSGVTLKVTCFTCGEEGHKSPQCPRNLKVEKAGNKGAQPKPIKRVWKNQTGGTQLEGVVNGHAAHVLLDSGADISVVPEDMVSNEQLGKGTVAVRPFGATNSMVLPLAEVEFAIGDLKWSEEVAVAPMLEGVNNEVLCSLKLQSERGLKLVLMANGVEQREVARVTTRTQAKANEQEELEEKACVATEEPTVKTLVPSGRDESNGPGEEVELEVSEQKDLGIVIEDDEQECLVIEESASEDEVEEDDLYQIGRGLAGGVDLEIPPVKCGKHGREQLVKETKTDPSLSEWRELASKKEKGLVWEKGLMFQSVTTQVLESELVLVLPKGFRSKVLRSAHDDLGHIGARRVKALLKARFSWPRLGKDVVNYCKSCPSCQTCGRSPARKVPLMERKVFSEPFEVMGFDIVGPMPKGRGGYQYLLTAICMATRWPEAIPLKSITAKAVAMGMSEIFCRMGIPLQLVTDQGTQFVGKMMKILCNNLHIDKRKRHIDKRKRPLTIRKGMVFVSGCMVLWVPCSPKQPRQGKTGWGRCHSHYLP